MESRNESLTRHNNHEGFEILSNGIFSQFRDSKSQLPEHTLHAQLALTYIYNISLFSLQATFSMTSRVCADAMFVCVTVNLSETASAKFLLGGVMMASTRVECIGKKINLSIMGSMFHHAHYIILVSLK